MRRLPSLLVRTLVFAALLPLPAVAGTIRGSASIRERIVLPPEVVFEAVLIDAALADAPAPELGRFRARSAGQSPFRFAIPYRESDLTPQGRYAVRATLRLGDRLLFTTDTFNPVLTGDQQQPLRLRLVRVEQPSAGANPQGPLGALPASWRGEITGPEGISRWQVDLAADGSFQLRQAFPRLPVPNVFDDIGRWRLESGGRLLVLQGGREAPVILETMAGGGALLPRDRLGTSAGRPVGSLPANTLVRLSAAAPIEPRLHLLGLFRYQADAASLQLCATGARLPVAMEADYLRLERAYLRALPTGAAGRPVLVNLEGQIAERPSAEPGQPPRRSLVVERFLGAHPGRGCPSPPVARSPRPRLQG